MAHLAPHEIAALRKGLLDGAELARVEGHLAACQRCRTADLRVSGALEALAEIGGLDAPALPSQARIEATLRWTRQNPSLGVGRAWAWGFGLAAAAALTMVIGWRHFHRTPAPPVVAKAVRAVPAPQPVPQPLEALVTLVGGEARVAHGAGAPAAPTVIDLKTPLRQGDRVETSAGRLAFQWGEGSGAFVHASSELALARLDPRRQELALRRGEVSVRVGPHQPGESLRVTTPDHEVTVHGTWFNVYADSRGGTVVEVLEGVVEVRAVEGDASSTRLAAPQRAVFPRGTGTASHARSLSGREAAALRLASEMALLPQWPGADRAAEATGFLRVASTPPASIVSDGVAFGTAPLALRRSMGRHLIELSRPGFTTLSRWVTVGPETGELKVALLPEEKQPEATPPDEDEMHAILRERRRQISACYEHSLKRDPTLAGTVTLEIKIGDAGQVLGSRVSSDTVPDGEVADCLRKEAAGWAFPTARNATVVYPFVFRTP